MADSTVVTGDRGVFGLTPATAAPASPLRVQGAPARAAAAPVVSLDANGDLRVGALDVADIPAAFTRDDVAETIAQPWTFSAGLTVGAGVALTFAAGGVLQPPQASTRSTGTRLILEPVAASTEYAIGRETNALWTSVPVGSEHRWYQGNVCRLRMQNDGAVWVENGSGYLVLSGPSGPGCLWGYGGLAVVAGSGSSGGIEFTTGNGLIVPSQNYRENLGLINRKYLTLHAAELWVETLVAQQTMATIGGRVLVAPTTTLTRDCAPTDGTIYVKHNLFQLGVVGVEYGSKILLEGRDGSTPKFEVMAVTDVTAPAATAQGDYPYAVLRGPGDGSSTSTKYQWYAGDAVLDTGKQTGAGGRFIDLYSLNGVNAGTDIGPTIVGNVRTSWLATAWAERWAIGNLRGLYGNGSTDVVGAAFGPPDGVHLQIDATNGIRMLGASNTPVYGHWRTNGDLVLGDTTKAALTFIAAEGSLNLQVNGSYKMRLLNDGTMLLSTGLVVGDTAGQGTVRSVGAYNYNSGDGFYFWSNSAGVSAALIGNSAGRRIQWDGASLKIVSDGFTLDENGIALSQGTASSPTSSRTIRWLANGATMWDTDTGGYFGAGGKWELQRYRGSIHLLAASSTEGAVHLQGGGTGYDQAFFVVRKDGIFMGGSVSGGGEPPFGPYNDNAVDCGRSGNRWRNLWVAGNIVCGNIASSAAFAASSWIGIGAPATQGSYQIALSADSAAKPGTATWTVASGRSVKRDERDVDPADALARIRRVPMKRFTFNGAAGTIDGAEGIGPVADDVRDVLPDSVREVDGTLMFNAHELFMLNVAAVQALAARLDALAPPKGTDTP